MTKEAVKTFYKSHQIFHSHVSAERQNLQTYVGRTRFGRAWFHKIDDTERAIMKLGISGNTSDVPILLKIAELEYNESILCEIAVDSLLCLKQRGHAPNSPEDFLRFNKLFLNVKNFEVRVGA